MDDVEIYIKHQVFRPRALLSISLSVTAAFPLLYSYLLLGTVDLFHPLQFIMSLFGSVFTAVLYWMLVTVILFFTLAYRITFYKVMNEKLSSPMERLSLALSRSSILLAFLHGFSSFLVACVLTSMIGGRYTDLLVECHTTHRCLNEEKWFIVLFCTIIGFIFSMEMAASGGYSLCFYSTEKPVMKRLKDVLPSLVKASTRAVRRASIVYYPAYILFGSSTVKLARRVLFLDDDDSMGLKSWWSFFDLTLLYQMYIAGVLVRFTWALSLFFFHACVTMRARFELCDTTTGASLLAALQLKQDNLTKMLAFKDLAMIASTCEDDRRARIFSLSMPGGHPKTWSTILSVTKGSLTELLQRLESTNEKLLSAYKGIISHQASKIETIKPGFHNPGAAKQASNVGGWRPTLLYKAYSDSLAGEVFHDGQKYIWSLTALSSLITRSVTEDKYGIVQQSLGEILVLLLSIHQAIESLFKMAPSLAKAVEEEDVNRRSHLVGVKLREQAKLSLEPIASTFQPHIEHIAGMTTEQMKQLRSFAR
ncbi:nucleoporin NDC1-like [Watersipora subatra]|uniref:nucleoporin NDC1-like n=1 Tax=Watersipora subatra TaxID=2589382 RepID=UPI00355AF3F0